jgi:hypothetical protein
MSSESKERTVHISFQPPKKSTPTYSLGEIHEISFPGITTTISKLPNSKPNIVPLKAVDASSEHQQYVDYAMHNVDPSLITGKKSNSKSPIQYYSAKQLREIATNLGLDPGKTKKADLSVKLLERVNELRTEGEAQMGK